TIQSVVVNSTTSVAVTLSAPLRVPPAGGAGLTDPALLSFNVLASPPPAVHRALTAWSRSRTPNRSR
ncbi:MAG: hypothetical protein LC745_12955, partial [Planctomycetia bacterium]|nr:hypothetical protein [Planctomycetia bacterium]